MKTFFSLVLMLFCACAQAQVYKCKQADGSTLYSSLPCPSTAQSSEQVEMPQEGSGRARSEIQKLDAKNPPTTLTAEQQKLLEQYRKGTGAR
jgi:hypothetical protein